MNVNQELEKRSILPPGWRWEKLGQICKLSKGRTPREEWYSDGGVWLVRFRDVAVSGVTWNSGFRTFVSAAYASELKELQPNTVLMTADAHDPKAIGKKVCLIRSIPAHAYPAYYSGELLGIMPEFHDELIPEWIFYWIRSDYGYQTVQEYVDGVHLNVSRAADMSIPLPPLAAQKRIAAILNEQMGAIEKARAAAQAQLEAAKALSIAYYKKGFGNITPLSVRVNPVQTAPGWKWRLLKDVARLESGHTPSRYHPEWWGGDIPWLALPDIRDLDGRYAYETREYTNAEGIDNSSARILPAGTVCFSRTASVGYVTILGRPMATSQDFVNWVCGLDLDPEFLMHLFLYSREYFISLASGAIHKTVYMPTVERLSVLVPAINEQKRIAAVLDDQMASTEKLRNNLKKQLHEINSLPVALLRRAFNGEL